MRSFWILLVVGLVGLGLGWILSAVLHDGHPGAGPPAAVEPVAAPEPPPGEARLVGLPPPESREPVATSPPAPAPVSAAPSDADLEVVEFLGPDGYEVVSDLEVLLPTAPGELRGWHALLTLYALAGRDTDFLRVVARALEAGMDGSSVLELLQLLPREKHVAALDHLLATWKDVGWSVAVVADVYTSAGAGERAVEVLVPALEEGADADLATRLVWADADRAARLLGAMSGGEGWDAGLLGRVGSAFLEASRPDLALPFLQDALAREPLDQGALTSLGAVDPSLALEHARKLTRLHPDRGDVWTWLGRLEQQGGNREAAFEAWREAGRLSLSTEVLYGMMEADPERAYQAATEMIDSAADDEVLGAVAKIALKSGRVEDTLATLLRAHERDPSDHEWMVAMVTLDVRRAAEVLERTVSTYGGDSRDEVLGAYGNALLGLGNADEAFERYREAYELDPGDWEWQRGLARSDAERAIPLLEARREEAGEEGDLVGALADAYAGVGRHEEALEHYERAARIGGGDEWYARMGRLDPDRALAALDRRVGESPESAETWAALGDLYRELGNREEARRAYARARELDATRLVYEIRYRQTER